MCASLFCVYGSGPESGRVSYAAVCVVSFHQMLAFNAREYVINIDLLIYVCIYYLCISKATMMIHIDGDILLVVWIAICALVCPIICIYKCIYS